MRSKYIIVGFSLITTLVISILVSLLVTLWFSRPAMVAQERKSENFEDQVSNTVDDRFIAKYDAALNSETDHSDPSFYEKAYKAEAKIPSVIEKNTPQNPPIKSNQEKIVENKENVPTNNPVILTSKPVVTQPYQFVKRPYMEPLQILETFPSLKGVREHLNSITATGKQNGGIASGKDILSAILDAKKYNPNNSVDQNDQLFGFLNEFNFKSNGDRIFLINLATGLYAESVSVYPWSLKDYNIKDVNTIFIFNDAMHLNAKEWAGDLPSGMPNLQFHLDYPVPNSMIEEAHYEQYRLAQKLVKSSKNQKSAVENVILWFEKNFFHAQENYGWELYLDGREPNQTGPVAFPLNVKRMYDERVIGCHEPTIMLEGLFHNLNIPALRLWVHGHGVLYLPTFDRYVHGDHVANYAEAPSGISVMTPAEFMPYAKDVKFIFDIYMKKYQTPLYVNRRREGNYLTIGQNQFDQETKTCRKVTEQEWNWFATHFAEFNIAYNTETCELTGSKIKIKQLSEY